MNNTAKLCPSRTVVTSFASTSGGSVAQSYEGGVWVLHVCCGNSWLGGGLSNGSIQLFDQARLQPIRSYDECRGGHITDLSSDNFNALIASYQDNSMRLFDIRQATTCLRFNLLNKKEEALSVDLGCGGVLAAVGGSKAKVHFFDLRSGGKFLGSYQDSHTQEVTRVRFQPSESTGGSLMLLSASEDGLACIFDTSQTSEEAALQGVLNVQTPLREVGFFGPQYEGVYCLTGSETLSVWHHDTAQRICDFGFNLRKELTELGRTHVDYLVDCHWNATHQQLLLLTGSHEGEGTVFQVDAGAISPQNVLNSGHRGDIRSWCHLSGDVFATVGEDARLCEWNRATEGSQSTQQRSRAPARRKPEKVSKSGQPY